jgi:hypothetical protein
MLLFVAWRIDANDKVILHARALVPIKNEIWWAGF